MKRATTIRLSEEARSALDRLAQKDCRSMSSYLEKTIRDEAIKQGVWSPKRALTVQK